MALHDVPKAKAVTEVAGVAYLGTHQSTVYNFYYMPDQITVLDFTFLSTLEHRGESTVIYADQCTLSADTLAELHIIFKKIPRDIARI